MMDIGSCPPFFFSNAISSVAFGSLGAGNSERRSVEGVTYKKELNTLKEQFEDEQFQFELKSNRARLQQGRRYQVEQAQRQFEQQKRKLEFDYFKNNCWPLVLDINTIWHLHSKEERIQPLSIIVSAANSAAVNYNKYYRDFCTGLRCGFKDIANTSFYAGAWKDEYKGGMAQGLNLHYLMQGLPTLLIMPYYQDGQMHINVSMWSFSRAGIESYNHYTALSVDYNDRDYNAENALKLGNAMQLVAGVVRDSYMISEYQTPAILPALLKERFSTLPKSHQEFLIREYGEMQKITNSSLYQSLCENQQSIENTHQSSLLPSVSPLTTIT